MFAYCCNNPAISSDPSGRVCIFENDRRDYGNGCVEYTDSGTGSKPDYLDNQDDPSIANLPFGFSNVSASGCGSLAIHNGLIDLGDYTPYGEILSKISNNLGRYTIAFGIGGMAPWHVVKYFRELGYSVSIYDGYYDGLCDYDYIDAFSSMHEVCIVWYIYSTSSNCLGYGAHFVEYHRGHDGIYTAHNIYGKSETFRRPSDFIFAPGNREYVIILGIDGGN